MAEGLTVLPSPPKGVALAEPSQIADAIKRQVDSALRAIPDGKSGALLGVATVNGVNIVVAHRTKKTDWDVAAWVGKDWSGPITGGVAVRKTW